MMVMIHSTGNKPFPIALDGELYKFMPEPRAYVLDGKGPDGITSAQLTELRTWAALTPAPVIINEAKSDSEVETLKAALAKAEKRIKELETQLSKRSNKS